MLKGFKGFILGFRDFIFRGNIIDLAIAVVIGLAFTALVNAVVTDLITPIIAALGGQPHFEDLVFTINKSQFKYGAFLNAVITFLSIAAVVYYLIVLPMSKITGRFHKEAEVTTRDCPECLSSIPLAATRCMYCTTQVPPAAPPTRAFTPQQ
jgi:large conductance mechanosensitive channel